MFLFKPKDRRFAAHSKSALSLAIALLLTLPSPLLAHARLVRSDPAANAKLTSSPSSILLVFTEVPELALSSVRLVRPGADTVVLSSLSHHSGNRHILIAALPAALEPGSYRVIWQVAASDGHATKGTIDFSVLPQAADTSVATAKAPATMPDEHDTGNIAIGGAIGAIIARWISFIAIFLVIGVVAFRFLVLHRVSGDEEVFSHIGSTSAATLGIFASAAGLVGAMLKLVRESSDMPDASLGSLLFGSLWGVSLLLQAMGCVVAIAAFAAVHKTANATRARAWTAALIAAIALAVSPPLGGHAAAAGNAWLAIPADIVHVTVGGMWLGTLATIVVAGISAAFKTPDDTRPGPRVASMINTFSPLALMCGGAVVATGIASSVLRLTRVSDLWTTPYGITLLLKVFFVGMLFAAGAWNWRRMKPRLTGENAIAPLRSTAWLELLLATAVLGITAILVALELP